MFVVMKCSKQGLICLAGALVLSGACLKARADAKSNPYDAIVERNLFGLKPPPLPDTNSTSTMPAAPPAQVEVTGITSILSSKRVLLEIVPGPGKPMLKPILSEGERVESVEVVFIDVEKNEVTIKNGSVLTNLTFKVAKAATPPAPTLSGFVPPAVPSPIVQPVIRNPANPNAAPAGRNSVMVAGGNGSAPPANPVPATPTFGGQNPAVPNPPVVNSGADAGFRQIPSRPVRTTTPQGSAAPITREEQYINVELNKMLNQQINENAGKTVIPPLPPTPLSPTTTTEGNQPVYQGGPFNLLPPKKYNNRQ